MPEPLPATTGPAVPPDHVCAACGYLMGPSGSRTCSECGRVATDEDLTQSLRRRVYVEATLVPTVAAWLVATVGAMSLLGYAPITIGYAIFALLHAGVMAAVVGHWGSRMTADRVMHIATLRSGWVLHVPLLAGIAALEFMEANRWRFMLGSPRQGNLALPDAIGIGAPLLVLLGIVLHRAMARRAHRIAGITEFACERTTPLVQRGWLYPPLFASALIAIGYVLHVLTR
ncbi:hypothetical protein AY599_02925 [Leptolyngbya valderiana BDU 20041]|nr:hypothetical protein AY599_02925 [Leptolyngbya valderiana BDU 20041]